MTGRLTIKSYKYVTIFVDQALRLANGHIEGQIRDLQGLTRSQLIFAAMTWQGCIIANLWSYTMILASEANSSPSPHNKVRRTPEQIFRKTATNINVKHFKPFGCPAYVSKIEAKNQSRCIPRQITSMWTQYLSGP